MTADPFRDFELACTRLISAHVEVPPDAAVSVPPRREFGDLSSNVAFLLAKPMRKAPRQIAQELQAAIDPSGEPLVDHLEVAGPGHLNFFLDQAAYAAHVLASVQRLGAAFGPTKTDEPLRVLVEHTSVNPNKEWHIGHARNCVLGDVVARMYRAAGHDVEVQNYIDDTGKQASDSIYAMQYFDATAPEDVKLDHYVGEQYVKLHAILGREDDARAELAALAEGDPAAEALMGELERIDSIKVGIVELMHDVEAGKYVGDVSRLLDAQLKTAWSLGVSYDLLSWEGDVVRSGLFDEAMTKIKASPYVYLAEEGKKAGCWVINMTDFWEGGKSDDDDVLEKVLVRTNGLPTYEGKDIAYQMWKFGLLERDMRYRVYAEQPDGRTLYTTWREGEGRPDRKTDRVINVIDNRQSYAQAAVYTALRVTGHEKEYRNSLHMAYGVVYLRSGHMSGRKGIGISADEVIESTREEAYRRTLEKRSGELDEPQMRAIAEAVARSSVRYCMIQYNPLKEILFDIDQVLSLDGNTSSYLQYALVRTESLGRRAAEAGIDMAALWSAPGELDLSDLTDEEIDLVKAVARYPVLFDRALENLAPHFVTDYAFELASLFTQFYHKCSVLKAETPELVQRRLALTWAVNQVLSNVFDLLGLDRLAAM
jgi:arginyl-tRNA synthetase